MKIAVIGACGRIGSVLCAAWSGRHDIQRYDSAEGYDLTRTVDLGRPDVVVHLAVDPGHDLRASRANAAMTLNVLEACEQVPRLICASSVWAEPEVHGVGPFDCYSADKLYLEALCRAWATGQRTAVCLRLALYEPGATEADYAANPSRLDERNLVASFDKALAQADAGCHVWLAVGRGPRPT